MTDRHLDWDGCFNVRDLGGLRTVDGRETRRGAIVRADCLERLTPRGWDSLRAYGLRTIVDLLEEDEREPVEQHALTTVHVPLDDRADREFWGGDWEHGPQFATPVYYKPFLERKADRCAAVVAAVARAEPGGVAFHCGGGRDRTGLVAIAVLALVGVTPTEIAADYELSYERMPALYAALDENDQGPALQAFLAGRGTSARASILETLESVDVEAHLRAAGLSQSDLAGLRARLLA